MDDKFSITPFWNRIPKFFLYGLHRNPLILAGVLFAIALIFGGPILNLVLIVVAIKYGTEALKRSMEGDFTPPNLSGEVISSNFGLALKLIFVFFIYIYGLTNVVGWLGMLLGLPIFIVGILLIPAVVISFVVSEEIIYSLNPLNWWHIAYQIGWPYLIMVVFLFFINVINTQFIGFIVHIFPRGLVFPLFVGLNVYFTVVMFHLLGYVVLQYHEQLGGYTPSALDGNTEIKKVDPYMTPALKKLLEEENVNGAINEMNSMIERNPQELELRRRLYVYLKMNGKNEALSDFAPIYFNRLAENNRYTDATTVYLETALRGYAFHPDHPGDYLPVMRELRRRLASKQAVQLAQGFHKRFPNDQHIPEVYLALAQILSEDIQRDDLAQQTLNFVLKCFPGHSLVPQVRQHLTVLSKLQGSNAVT